MDGFFSSTSDRQETRLRRNEEFLLRDFLILNRHALSRNMWKPFKKSGISGGKSMGYVHTDSISGIKNDDI